MLGDYEIYGQLTRVIDEKNRIILPKEFGVEKEEQLLLYKEEDYCSIYSKSKLENIITIKNQSFEDEKKEIDKIALKILALLKVDAVGRITIPKGILDYYGLENQVLLVGAKNHINIYSGHEKVISKKRIRKLQ